MVDDERRWFPNLTGEMDESSTDSDAEEIRGENRFYVRRYYRAHRDEIMLRKTERACRLHGRVPRAQTILDHSMPVTVLTNAFRQWAASRDPEDERRVKRVARFRQLHVQLNDMA